MVDIPRRGLSPLWIIALFLSFSETVLGIAVMQTSGGIQIALTTFVISFPAIVSGLFFLVLWKKAQVFYPPTEFTNEVGVRAYAEAMQFSARQPPPAPVSEAVIRSLESRIASISATLDRTSDPKQQAELILQGAVDAVKESVVRIDSSPLLGGEGTVWEVAFEPDASMSAFLDRVWFGIRSRVPAYTYGEKWALRIAETGKILTPAGRVWAMRQGADADLRPLRELGVKGGMLLDVVPLQPPVAGK